MARLTFTKPASLAKLQRIRDMLAARPMNVHEIADALPISKRWAIDYVLHLHDCQEIHVLRWDKEIEARAKRHAVEVWTLGPGVDAPRPEPDGHRTRAKRAWESLKADPERHMVTLAKRRARRRLKNLRPDPAAAWLMSTPAQAWPFPLVAKPYDGTRPRFNPNNCEDALL
jgi:hypothetical protein